MSLLCINNVSKYHEHFIYKIHQIYQRHSKACLEILAGLSLQRIETNTEVLLYVTEVHCKQSRYK